MHPCILFSKNTSLWLKNTAVIIDTANGGCEKNTEINYLFNFLSAINISQGSGHGRSFFDFPCPALSTLNSLPTRSLPPALVFSIDPFLCWPLPLTPSPSILPSYALFKKWSCFLALFLLLGTDPLPSDHWVNTIIQLSKSYTSYAVGCLSIINHSFIDVWIIHFNFCWGDPQHIY